MTNSTGIFGDLCLEGKLDMCPHFFVILFDKLFCLVFQNALLHFLIWELIGITFGCVSNLISSSFAISLCYSNKQGDMQRCLCFLALLLLVLLVCKKTKTSFLLGVSFIWMSTISSLLLFMICQWVCACFIGLLKPMLDNICLQGERFKRRLWQVCNCKWWLNARLRFSMEFCLIFRCIVVSVLG